jgi:hypothetical protein
MFASEDPLDALQGALDEMLRESVSLGSAREAATLVRSLEACNRRLRAAQLRVQAEIDASGVYAADAHASAKVMTRHCARLSPAAAAGRERGARMAQALPEVGDALGRGVLGIDYFDPLARVWANPRVRDHMADAQSWFLRIAARLSYRDFETEVRTWERLADDDGPEPANSRNHDNRDVRLAQDPVDLGWQWAGGCGAMQGAQMSEILEHYVSAERLADWEKARAELGETATASDLPRTEAQRRADAVWQVFQDAAANPASACPDIVHNIVWDADTITELARRFGGGPSRPLDPTTSVCRTLDGVALEPSEAFASVFVDKLRRVVVDAAGVVVDLGRARRFTGGARLAVQLADSHCPWPGCEVPTSACEIDHSIDHARGGGTNPDNGGPLCGRHNRHKQKGFAVWRDPSGVWHTYRPDGSAV